MGPLHEHAAVTNHVAMPGPTTTTFLGFDLRTRPRAFGCFYFALLPWLLISLVACAFMFVQWGMAGINAEEVPCGAEVKMTTSGDCPCQSREGCTYLHVNETNARPIPFGTVTTCWDFSVEYTAVCVANTCLYRDSDVLWPRSRRYVDATEAESALVRAQEQEDERGSAVCVIEEDGRLSNRVIDSGDTFTNSLFKFVAGCLLIPVALFATPMVIIAACCRRDSGGIGGQHGVVCGFDATQRPRVFGVTLCLLPSIMVCLVVPGVTLLGITLSISDGALWLYAAVLLSLFLATLLTFIVLCCRYAKERPPTYADFGLVVKSEI